MKDPNQYSEPDPQPSDMSDPEPDLDPKKIIPDPQLSTGITEVPTFYSGIFCF